MDNWDQDHAMFLAEGTNVGILQSIMMKPPNIAPVYPLRKQKPQKEILYVSPSTNLNAYTGKKGPLIFWNLELLNPKDSMYAFGPDYDVDYFLRSFLEMTLLWKKDYEVIILVPPSYFDTIKKTVDSYGFTRNQHISVHPTEDPFNLEVDPWSWDLVH